MLAIWWCLELVAAGNRGGQEPCNWRKRQMPGVQWVIRWGLQPALGKKSLADTRMSWYDYND